VSAEAYAVQRKRLVDALVFSKAVQSDPVKRAFLAVPREDFLPAHLKEYAYADDALPLELGQSISQPSTIAHMLELLDVKEGNRVFEVGAGSGYAAALLSRLVGENGMVYAIEFLPFLKKSAEENLKRAGIQNVEVLEGDGSMGLQQFAPFDRIISSAGCPYVPKPWIDQLAEGGIIVAPVGDKFDQHLQVVLKHKGKIVKRDDWPNLYNFVPLRGKFGWK